MRSAPGSWSRSLNTNTPPDSCLSGTMLQPVMTLAKLVTSAPDGMQLHDLASEILVDSFAAALACKRVRTNRLHIIEIQQHRRVHFDRQQHIGKFAAHMPADRLTLESAAQRAYRTLVGRDTKVV